MPNQTYARYLLWLSYWLYTKLVVGNQEICLKQFFSGYPYRIRFKIFCFLDTVLQIRVCNLKIIFFIFLNQNVFCGYSKEQSHWDASLEHPKHMFKLKGKKINSNFKLKISNQTYAWHLLWSHLLTLYPNFVVGNQENHLQTYV